MALATGIAANGVILLFLAEDNILGLRPKHLLGFHLTPEYMFFHKGQFVPFLNPNSSDADLAHFLIRTTIYGLL